MRPLTVDRRTRTVVAIVAGAVLGAAAVAWMLTPRFEVEQAGEHLVVGGFSVPAEGLPAHLAGSDVRPGTVLTGFSVTSTGLFTVRVSNPRPVIMDEGADITVALWEPDARGNVHGPAAVQVASGDVLTLWVTISQRACSPGMTSRIERGVRGVTLDVTAWGVTRTEVLDIDVAAYAETPDGVLPRCT